ncbi:class I SAM-dependent methyltransferase [Yinghuangia soli]|uniref:Class I SAM-dependent methyltransferase n=1 Tax=Yinghuangia soli TaxID=2908204 RepID=A0AA41U250_9ACTN|nr:class I SAM-dependent methyltransferase [Yinghuangia soli]MCF2528242.1 class I SAM-dependent methyltransferase [Yinghuangia soli]
MTTSTDAPAPVVPRPAAPAAAPAAAAAPEAASAARLQAFYQAEDTPYRSGQDRIRRQLALLKPVVEHAVKPLTLLDLGCGDGHATARMARLLSGPQHRVIGVDWSETALARARARGVQTVRAALDAGPLPFDDGAADIVVMSEIVEHLVDPDAAVAEAYRVLRPGGHLFLSTPNLAAWFNRMLLLAGVQPAFSEVALSGIYGRPGADVAGHLRLFTRRALVEFLTARGFRRIRITGAAFEAVPAPGRPLDRLLTRVPSASAILLAHARTPVRLSRRIPAAAGGSPSAGRTAPGTPPGSPRTAGVPA